MTQTPKRPGIVMVAAILLLIFSSYALLGGFCSVFSILFSDAVQKMMPQPPGGAQNQIDAQAFLAKEVPSYVPVEIGFAIISILVGVAGVIAGINVLRVKSVGRKLGIAVALGSIVLMVAHSVYTGIFILPATNRLFEQQAKMMPAPIDLGSIMKGSMLVGLVLGVLFQTAIWLTVFFLLNAKKSRDAFAGKLIDEPVGAYQDERHRSKYEGYDDEDDRPPLPKSPPDTGITDKPT